MFVVRSKEDVLPAIKRLQSGRSVIVVPSLLSTFKREANRKGIELSITNFGWGYKIASKEKESTQKNTKGGLRW